jgi:hypothetical protein
MHCEHFTLSRPLFARLCTSLEPERSWLSSQEGDIHGSSALILRVHSGQSFESSMYQICTVTLGQQSIVLYLATKGRSTTGIHQNLSVTLERGTVAHWHWPAAYKKRLLRTKNHQFWKRPFRLIISLLTSQSPRRSARNYFSQFVSSPRGHTGGPKARDRSSNPCLRRADRIRPLERAGIGRTFFLSKRIMRSKYSNAAGIMYG